MPPAAEGAGAGAARWDSRYSGIFSLAMEIAISAGKLPDFSYFTL